MRQHTKPLHAVFVPIGGGGLISGIAAYIKSLHPEIKIIGVEPADSNAMYLSLQKGRRVRLPQVGVFADGVAIKQVGKETFRLCRELVDEIILLIRMPSVRQLRTCLKIRGLCWSHQEHFQLLELNYIAAGRSFEVKLWSQ